MEHVVVCSFVAKQTRSTALLLLSLSTYTVKFSRADMGFAW
jgi:hypothetical protein